LRYLITTISFSSGVVLRFLSIATKTYILRVVDSAYEGFKDCWRGSNDKFALLSN